MADVGHSGCPSVIWLCKNPSPKEEQGLKTFSKVRSSQLNFRQFKFMCAQLFGGEMYAWLEHRQTKFEKDKKKNWIIDLVKAK